MYNKLNAKVNSLKKKITDASTWYVKITATQIKNNSEKKTGNTKGKISDFCGLGATNVLNTIICEAENKGS